MFNSAMAGKVEKNLFSEYTIVQIAFMNNQLIAFRFRFGNHLTVGVHLSRHRSQ